jgi:hypothetical protein
MFAREAGGQGVRKSTVMTSSKKRSYSLLVEPPPLRSEDPVRTSGHCAERRLESAEGVSSPRREALPQGCQSQRRFNRLEYLFHANELAGDQQHLASRIRADVLWGIGLMDAICPPSSQFATYNKIKSDKSMAISTDYGHEMLPGSLDQSFQFLMGI